MRSPHVQKVLSCICTLSGLDDPSPHREVVLNDDNLSRNIDSYIILDLVNFSWIFCSKAKWCLFLFCFALLCFFFSPGTQCLASYRLLCCGKMCFSDKNWILQHPSIISTVSGSLIFLVDLSDYLRLFSYTHFQVKAHSVWT